ncbi:MFS transporter, FHS family, L-fucose permease [Granulicella rosea]|uniref:MFS transporter, FHS family, L-fucose permease n=1 Tax=Granulicella rosea TaxID=474952 RepID=A0A239D8U8_9BACT|nr:sugar MFS transporter [Granulicella rosea]SNS28760.1 MFS transporter, FHS family, L-fucose permease [Granulicella rosea]
MAMASSGNTQFASSGSTTNRGALTVVTTLFFMWGFCTVLNDALIPHLMSIFALTYLKASLIQLAFFGSYFLFAQPASKLIETVGYQRTMVVGLITMAVGALLFLPAAQTAQYPLFLAAQVVLAAGVTVLQVAANPYVTILGPPETAASRLNLTQAFNTLGDTVAPYFGSILILGATTAATAPLDPAGAMAFRIHQAASVKMPYILIAGILILLALAIALYKFPRIEVTQDFRPGANDLEKESIWKHRHVWLGALAIFIYVGAEVSIGSFLAKYIADPAIGNMTLQSATQLVTLYWAGMMVGRFVGAAVMQRVAPNKLLVLVGGGAALMVLGSLLTTGTVAMVTILAVGLFNSIMFPTIFTLGVAELGPLTGRGSGLLVQAIVGGAGVPVLMGAMADRVGIHRALILPFICYLFIIYYGLAGYRIQPGESQSHLEAVKS